MPCVGAVNELSVLRTTITLWPTAFLAHERLIWVVLATVAVWLPGSPIALTVTVRPAPVPFAARLTHDALLALYQKLVP